MAVENELCLACDGFQVVTWPDTRGRNPVTVVAACHCTDLGWSAVVREPTPAKIEDAVTRMRERVLGKIQE